MLKWSLCDYNDVYIPASGTITVSPHEGFNPNNNNKEVVLCIVLIDCISEKNNTQIDNTKYIDIVIPIYNLIQYSDNHSKTSESLWQYYRDQLALNDVGAVAKFSAAKNNSASFKLKQKITGWNKNWNNSAIKIFR